MARVNLITPPFDYLLNWSGTFNVQIQMRQYALKNSLKGGPEEKKKP